MTDIIATFVISLGEIIFIMFVSLIYHPMQSIFIQKKGNVRFSRRKR